MEKLIKIPIGPIVGIGEWRERGEGFSCMEIKGKRICGRTAAVRIINGVPYFVINEQHEKDKLDVRIIGTTPLRVRSFCAADGVDKWGNQSGRLT